MAYIIHNSAQVIRKPIVDNIIKLTNAKVFEAIMLKNRIDGCRQSHIEVYNLVKEYEPVIVFEDDCEIIDESFMNLIENHSSSHDIIFFGTYKTFSKNNKIQIWGTHAMWISPYAKKLFLDNVSSCKIPQVDEIWNELIIKYNLKVWVPPRNNMYVRQKPGLISTITGVARLNVCVERNQIKRFGFR